jgi:hypothetical protein
LWRVRIAEFGTYFGTRIWRGLGPPGIRTFMAKMRPLTTVFTPDENGWTMAQLAEPAVVTCGCEFVSRPSALS